MSSALDRRRLLTAGGPAAAAIAGLHGRSAHAAAQNDWELRGQRGIFERLPDLNTESYQDFIRGVRQWSNFYGLAAVCKDRAKVVLEANGIKVDPKVTLKIEDILPVLSNDPIITLYGRTWLDGQYYKFRNLQAAFYENADACFDEMEANDKVGPGKLELNPTMYIPDYARHEIHTQPGGYVGDPLGGYIYLYDVLILNDGRDEQDAGFIARANAIPLPKDGKVKRVLDNGTGVGQLATSFQSRFPDAEVWGIDVGAPMLRYGHVRANDIGSKVNLRQALAEDNGFPDNYFDMIGSSQFHHEVTSEATRKIYKEAYRVLRPGGVLALEGPFGPPPNEPFAMFNLFLNWRWNHEDWMMDWVTMDRAGALKDAGFMMEPADPSKPAAGLVARKV